MTQSGKPLDERHETIESRTTRQVLVVVFIAAVLWLCFQLQVLLVDVIIAITIASAISPLATRAEERKKIPRPVTVLLTYVAVGAFYAFAAYMLWRPISEQATLLAQHLPGLVDSIVKWSDDLMMQHLGMHANLQVSQDDLRNFGTMALRRTLAVSTGVIGIVLNVILVLFLAAYFVINSKQIWSAILEWIPLRHRARIGALVGPVGARMGGYVRGQALVSTAVAAFFAVGLTLIGVKYSLVLGLVAGIMNLVPFVGSMITTILAVIIAANQSWLTAGLTLGLFALEQTVESNFIVPYLLGSQVELDPLIVLFAILIGATLGGAVGALIAVPIASALLLIGTELYKKPMHEQEAIL